MQSLRANIERLLKKENYTFGQLADHLNLTETELADGLEHKTLELRHLEEISKNLKVPLYSFFGENTALFDADQKPYYTNRLWDDNEPGNPQKIKEEIYLLRQAIASKEEQLAKSNRP